MDKTIEKVPDRYYPRQWVIEYTRHVLEYVNWKRKRDIINRIWMVINIILALLAIGCYILICWLLP